MSDRHSFEVEVQRAAEVDFLPPHNEYRAACSCGWSAPAFVSNISTAETEWKTRHLLEPPKVEGDA